MLPAECLSALVLEEAMTTRVSRTAEAFSEKRTGRPGQWEEAHWWGSAVRTGAPVPMIEKTPRLAPLARSDVGAVYWRRNTTPVHVNPADPPVWGAPVIPNGGRLTARRATDAEESYRDR